MLTKANIVIANKCKSPLPLFAMADKLTGQQ